MLTRTNAPAETAFDRWMREEMLPAIRADRQRELANPKPVRKPAPWWSEEYLNGDYAKVGSMQATEWGE